MYLIPVCSSTSQSFLYKWHGACPTYILLHSTSPELAMDPKQDPRLLQIAVPATPPHEPAQVPERASSVDYMARAQWLRAAVLGANDGLVSVASLMIGVGAVNQAAKAMLVSGLAGLVAGACSMAIGEFVSVRAQYDIEAAEMERRCRGKGGGHRVEEKESQLPNPLLAAGASAAAFAAGAALPLLAGGFIRSWSVRVAAVCLVSSLGLAGFGAAGAALGGANVYRSGFRVLVGGWSAMVVTYGVLRLFGLEEIR
ncbi:vacuolar iron transporter [Canna indica]|uniref:Vacuolar iron transporter n=1 Tax=Canna indica TaxID=4628 RepID=A0AAQ3Q8R2_9LILI|nr:vacuolar iron transporter [Canna indica]